MEEKLVLTQEWDKSFPQSDKVEHSKVTFHNRYGITLAADIYKPKDAEDRLAAFGAVKEQAAGLYAQTMAERGFLTMAFDPSFTGESGGQPRYMASPVINTEDFQAAVDYLSLREDVDPEKIGIIGICGWGGMALNAQRTKDYQNGSYALAGGVAEEVPEDAPFYVKDYHDYYKTRRGYHPRSLNSNGGWNVTGTMSFMNQPILRYSSEIRSAVLIIHGEKAHSCYFSRDAYAAMTEGNPNPENKELLIIPGAVHTDLYDKLDVIPFDKMADFFRKAMRQQE